MSIYLSIVVPLYNEEEAVEKLVRRIGAVATGFSFDYEIILVDDGSTDKTWSVIEGLRHSVARMRAIKFRRNYGQTSAMVAGFDQARGKVIVTLDGDLQNDPADIPRLLQKLDEGYDLVSGWRVDRKDHYTRVWPSKIANAMISAFTGVRLHDYGCSLKAYRAECIKTLKLYGEMHRFFPALASMTGARVAELPVEHHPRQHGVSKYGFSRIFKVLSDIFAIMMIIKFSANPLKGFAWCALPFFLSAWGSGVLCVVAVMNNWTQGKALFFLISMALSLMAGVYLIALGLLGELVVHVSDLSHTQLSKITKRTVIEGA